MPLDQLERLIAPYGVAGQIGAGLAAVIFVVGGLVFLREAAARLTVASTDPVWSRVLHWGGPAVLALALIVLAVLAGGIAIKPLTGHADWLVASVSVLFFGGAVGAAELVSRYKDRPLRALCTAPAIFYILLNAIGALAALYLIYVYPDKLGFTHPGDDWPTGALVQAVLIAGFASLLFFRTSIFKFRVGDSDLAVGPSIVLDTLLTAADRAVDRVMAEPRARFVHDWMGQVAFDKAATILPAHCLALMQNVSSEESQRIAGVVNSLRADTNMPDKIKALNLGLALLTVVGEDVLRTAVTTLDQDLQDSTAQLLEQVSSVMEPVSFDRARNMLPPYCFALWPKPIADDVRAKFSADTTALSTIQDVPEQYKALILGIRLAKLTDGATLLKAVRDLGASIRSPRALPAPDQGTGSGTSPRPAAPAPPPAPGSPAPEGAERQESPTHVPYRGSLPAVTDVAAGTSSVMP